MDLMTLTSGFGQAINAHRTAVQTLDEAKITAATNELTGQLAHFGAEVLAMQKDGVQATERERAALARVHDLEDRVRELEKQASEVERYELVEEYPGTFAFRIKESARNGEPLHYVCPGCLDNKSLKSILQFSGPQKTIASCPACKVRYRFKESKRPTGSGLAGAPPGPNGWMGG